MNLTEAAATFIWPKFYVFGSILAESDIGLFDNENNELIVSLSLSLSFWYNLTRTNDTMEGGGKKL